MKLLLLQLKKTEERRVLAGHLWIYSNEIDTKATPLKNFSAGDLVQIQSSSGKPLGIGYVNPNNLLCVRVLTTDAQENIDLDFFIKRIEQALLCRQQIFNLPFYRLIFSESDFLPGLIVDRYDDILVAQITTAGMERFKDIIVQALRQTIKPAIRGILWRNDGAMRVLEGLPQYAEWGYAKSENLEHQVIFKEQNANFVADLWEGQKTGWFYDQRQNRERLAFYVEQLRNTDNARPLKVLDVCSYSGAWGVTAALNGAAEVLCVDSSAAALELVKRNAELNNVGKVINTLQLDLFEALKQLFASKSKFDIIILDPPAFIKRRKDVSEGSNAYLRLHKLALQLLQGNGLLFTTSCSLHLTQEMLLGIVRQAGVQGQKQLRVLEHLHQASDHPVHPAITETNYLKGFVVRG
jgi:23S rRNA (cytosine1962-C5)-methyltransferase